MEIQQDDCTKTTAVSVKRLEICSQPWWVERNIASSLGTIRIKDDDRKPTMALDDKEFEQLLAAVDRANGKTTDTMRKRLRSLILLQRWTGFAIRDACKLERKQIEPDPDNHGWHRVFIRRSKTGVPVYAALAGDIAKEILSAPNDNQRYMFTAGASDTHVRQAVQAFTQLFVKLDEAADLRTSMANASGFTPTCCGIPTLSGC